VAGANRLDTLLSAAVLPWPVGLVNANLPRHLAAGSPVRVAWPGGVPVCRDGYRPATGLLNRRYLPEMDGVRGRRCSHPRGCRNLFRNGGPGTRRDARYRRAGQRGFAGETQRPLEQWSLLTLLEAFGLLKGASASKTRLPLATLMVLLVRAVVMELQLVAAHRLLSPPVLISGPAQLMTIGVCVRHHHAEPLLIF
jgi:hypothetical protein